MTNFFSMPSDILIFIFTHLFSIEMWVAILALLVVMLVLGRYFWAALVLVGTTILLSVSIVVLKELFAVERPTGALVTLESYGFPSGHGAGIVYLTGVALALYQRFRGTGTQILAVAGIALILIVGASRIYLQVHTFDQVLAGYALGAVFAVLFWKGSKLSRTTK